MEDMNKLPKGMGGDRYLCNGNFVDLAHAGSWAQNNEGNTQEDKEEGEKLNE